MLGSPQGGPLEPFVQVGIVSFGARAELGGCDSPNFPGVFTRVSSVANWVRSTVCTRVGELCDGNQPTQRPNNRPTMQERLPRCPFDPSQEKEETVRRARKIRMLSKDWR